MRTSRRAAALVLALAGAGTACGVAYSGPIWDHAAWRLEPDSGADPWRSHAPDPSCRDAIFGLETFGAEPVLDIATGGCLYFSARQPLPAALEAGQELELRFEHADLTRDPDAEGPATGHLGIAVGGVEVWERTLSIPRTSATYVERIPLTAALAAGTPVVLHVHNHGPNVWSIGSLSALE